MRWTWDGWKDRVLYALVALAFAQITVLALARGGPLSGGPSYGPGYSFAGVEVEDGGGVTIDLATGRPTLVLVFHSRCAYCTVVAPDWASWLREPPINIRVVAVSGEPFSEAVAYASEHEWEVDVRVVGRGMQSPATRALTSRTPWVYGLDGDGRVVSSAHGSDVSGVVTELRRMVSVIDGQ